VPICIGTDSNTIIDPLAELREIEDSKRKHARRRLEVSREVRRAVWQSQTTALLRLRDAGEINDRDHQELQLEIDREHVDLVVV